MYCGVTPLVSVILPNVLNSVSMQATEKITNHLGSQGFAWLPNYHSALSLAQVAKTIGKLSAVSGLGRPHEIKPTREADSSPNFYSGNFGLDEFPMHTDMAHWATPPRFMILRCIQGDDSVSTRVVSISKALEGIRQSTIMRATFKPRKRKKGRLTLLPFCCERDGTWLYRWDQVFIKPTNQSADEVADQLSNVGSEAQSFSLSSAGDTLVIDNWRTLHGRSPVPNSALDRVIERVYLDSITL